MSFSFFISNFDDDNNDNNKINNKNENNKFFMTIEINLII